MKTESQLDAERAAETRDLAEYRAARAADLFDSADEYASMAAYSGDLATFAANLDAWDRAGDLAQTNPNTMSHKTKLEMQMRGNFVWSMLREASNLKRYMEKNKVVLKEDIVGELIVEIHEELERIKEWSAENGISDVINVEKPHTP